MVAVKATGNFLPAPSSAPVLTVGFFPNRRGQDGGEFQDLVEYNSFKPRRRSNSMSHPEDHLPSKFDHNEREPVFEEEVGEGGDDVAPLKSNDSAASSSSAASGK